jgi:hypothetical protein
MSTGEPEQTPLKRASTRPRRLFAAVVCACLLGLLAYLVFGRSTDSDTSRRLAACAGQGAPGVLSVAPQKLGRLRASVARVLPQRLGRLYEEGTIVGSTIWTDASPAGPTVSPTAKRPAGYEMRWWAPNGDDLVADVLEFADPATAARFMQRASGDRCGHVTLSGSASRPPQARNLAWLNPDHVAEADVYLARGNRVYRVTDVPSGQIRGTLPPAGLRRALFLVDTLACLLPGAHCSRASHNVPA